MRFPSFKRTISAGWLWTSRAVTAHSLLTTLGISFIAGISTFTYTIWSLFAGIPAPLAVLAALFVFCLIFFLLICLIGFYANFDELGWGMVSLRKAAQLLNQKGLDSKYIQSARAQAAFEDNQSPTNRVASNIVKNVSIFGKIDDSDHLEHIPENKAKSGRVVDDGYKLLYRYDKATYRYNDLHLRKRDLRDFIKKVERSDLDG